MSSAIPGLPDSVRIASVRSFGAPLSIVEVPLPEPEPGAAVVRILASTICGSDVHAWHGQVDLPVTLPVMLGHEGVGEVVALGPGADVDSVGSAVRLGTRLVWTPESCGHCHGCTVLRDETCCSNRRYGMFASCATFPFCTGTFGEYAYIPPRAGRVVVPSGIEDTWAAAASCALRTSVRAFERLGGFDVAETVLVQGAGPVGLFAVAMASALGARRVIVIDGSAERLAVAREWGASATIDIAELPDPATRRQAVLELSEGWGPSVGFEMSGAPGAFPEGLELMGRGGRYVVVGTMGGPPQAVNVPAIAGKNLDVLGVVSADAGTLAKSLRFMAERREQFDWNRVIGARFPLDQATEALERMLRQEAGKPVILPHG